MAQYSTVSGMNVRTKPGTIATPSMTSCSKCQKSLTGSRDKCSRCQKDLTREKRINMSDLIDKIDKLLIGEMGPSTQGRDSSSHAFDRHAAQQRKNQSGETVKDSPAARQKKRKSYEEQRKRWREEEQRKKQHGQPTG